MAVVIRRDGKWDEALVSTQAKNIVERLLSTLTHDPR